MKEEDKSKLIEVFKGSLWEAQLVKSLKQPWRLFVHTKKRKREIKPPCIGKEHKYGATTNENCCQDRQQCIDTS